MTRINCIPVSELTNKHLVAEYKEITRPVKKSQKAYWAKRYDFPDTYRLGKGHELFFFRRIGYIKRRYKELIIEMVRRGYKPKPSVYIPMLGEMEAVELATANDWTPTPEAMEINRQRIKERLEK